MPGESLNPILEGEKHKTTDFMVELIGRNPPPFFRPQVKAPVSLAARGRSRSSGLGRRDGPRRLRESPFVSTGPTLLDYGSYV